MWANKVKAAVEITTFCNARCPQCPRTASRVGTPPTHVGKAEWLPLKSWSFEEFKLMFNKETLSALHALHFSGTFGDPGMNPALVDMAYYLKKNGVRCTINSNGSMQDENFWFKLGMYADEITFDIDGINQEMHGKYRRGTKLSKVLENMDAAISAGSASIRVFTVVFKHNEDYVDDIKNMVMARGVAEHKHNSVESTRFDRGPIFEFINEDGELDTLEQTTKLEHYRDRETLTRRIRDHRDDMSTYNTIKCPALERQAINIGVTGLVTPCCYIGGPMDKVYGFGGSQVKTLDHDLFREMDRDSFLYNLKFTTLPEILKSDWFNKKLIDSFEDNPTLPCLKTCGKRI